MTPPCLRGAAGSHGALREAPVARRALRCAPTTLRCLRCAVPLTATSARAPRCTVREHTSPTHRCARTAKAPRAQVHGATFEGVAAERTSSCSGRIRVPAWRSRRRRVWLPDRPTRRPRTGTPCAPSPRAGGGRIDAQQMRRRAPATRRVGAGRFPGAPRAATRSERVRKGGRVSRMRGRLRRTPPATRRLFMSVTVSVNRASRYPQDRCARRTRSCALTSRLHLSNA